MVRHRDYRPLNAYNRSACLKAQFFTVISLLLIIVIFIVQVLAPLKTSLEPNRRPRAHESSRFEIGDDGNVSTAFGEPTSDSGNTRAEQPEAARADADVVWQFAFRPTLKPSKCDGSQCKFTERTVICVSSSAAYHERRRAIRQSWGSHPTFRVLFFVGASDIGMQEESDRYDDIVQYDFVDAYLNLTLKSVSMLKFLGEHRWQALEYFIKADDDTFINTRIIDKVLDKIPANSNTVYGSVQKGAKPVRDVKSKWFIPYDAYNKTVYPTYVTGCFYIIPIEVLKRMSENATAARFLSMEDTYITGILAEILKIKRSPVPFAKVDHSATRVSLAQVGSKFVAKHYVKPIEMIKMHVFLKDPTNTIG